MPDGPETTATAGEALSPAAPGSPLLGGAPARTPAPSGRSERGTGLRGWSRRHPLLTFTVRRVFIGIVLVWLVTVLVFLATSVLPSDPVGRILGRYATPENTAALREQLGLDGSLLERYWTWISGFVTGDFGVSVTRSGRPVSELLGGRLQNSLLLAGIGMALLAPLSIALGVWAGLRADRRADRVISGVTLSFIAVPDFVVGSVLTLVLAGQLGWLPPVSLVAPGTSPLADPSILVLPILTILIATIALGVRMVRAGMIEVMTSEYVELARLNGIPERRLVLRHALRNALAPTVQVLALLLPWMIGGLVVVETLFNYPGIGLGLIEAVTNSDYTYVQAVATLLAVTYVVLFTISDLLVVLLVPKLRTGRPS